MTVSKSEGVCMTHTCPHASRGVLVTSNTPISMTNGAHFSVLRILHFTILPSWGLLPVAGLARLWQDSTHLWPSLASWHRPVSLSFVHLLIPRPSDTSVPHPHLYMLLPLALLSNAELTTDW